MSIPPILDLFAAPPCAGLLGLAILEAGPDEGFVKPVFTARPERWSPDQERVSR